MLFDLLVEGTSRNTESLGSPLDATLLFLKHALDVLLLEFEKSQLGIKHWSADVGVAVEVEIFETDVFLLAQ